MFIRGCTSTLDFKVTTLKWPFYNLVFTCDVCVCDSHDYEINQQIRLNLMFKKRQSNLLKIGNLSQKFNIHALVLKIYHL